MKKENIIEITKEVALIQEDGTKIILEKGDKINVVRGELNEKTYYYQDMWYKDKPIIDYIEYIGRGFRYWKDSGNVADNQAKTAIQELLYELKLRLTNS